MWIAPSKLLYQLKNGRFNNIAVASKFEESQRFLYNEKRK